MNIHRFWEVVLAQDREALRAFFHDDAYVNWHCTNERFSLEEYIIANCDYPGDWDGAVQRVEELGNLVVTVTNVYPRDRSASFHVTSFIELRDGKIAAMDEYWADDGDAPQWRKRRHIGQPIR